MLPAIATSTKIARDNMLMSVRLIRQFSTPSGLFWKRFRTWSHRQRNQFCTQILRAIHYIWILSNHQRLRISDVVPSTTRDFLLNSSIKIDDQSVVLRRRTYRYVERPITIQRCFEAHNRSFRIISSLPAQKSFLGLMHQWEPPSHFLVKCQQDLSA